MNNLHTNKNSELKSFELDLTELVNALDHGKYIILCMISFFSILAVIISLSLPNIYQSKALLSSSEESSRLNNMLQGYSSIASLAGVNISSDASETNSIQAVKKLQSLSFFENNILPNINLPQLMAFESWDHKENKITIDEKIYNEKEKTWVRDFNPPQKLIPSAQESFEVFSENHLDIFEDSKTGFITLSIKHQSPHIAKEWVDLMVSEINLFYRLKDKSKAEKSVDYLNNIIAKTTLTEIQQVLALLLQKETEKLVMIEANEFYVFDYIDPPSVMEKKVEPNRAMICIVIALLGGILGVLIALFRYFFYFRVSKS